MDKTNKKFEKGQRVKLSTCKDGSLAMLVRKADTSALFGTITEVRKNSIIVKWDNLSASEIKSYLLEEIQIVQALDEDSLNKMKEKYPERSEVKKLCDETEYSRNFTDLMSFIPSFGEVERVNEDGSVDVCWDESGFENIPFEGHIKIAPVRDRQNPYENERIALLSFLCNITKKEIEGKDFDDKEEIMNAIDVFAKKVPLNGYKILVFSKTLLDDPFIHEQIVSREELVDLWEGFSELYQGYRFIVTDNLYMESVGNPLIIGEFGSNTLEYTLKNL